MESSSVRLLDAHGLHFAYGEHRILGGVDLSVDSGEIVGVLGPNGAGKTTLLGVLTGWLRASSGTIHVRGDRLADLNRQQVAKRIAVVKQENRFAFPFSALEVVLMGRHPHRTDARFESAADLETAYRALQRCDAEDLAHRPISELSSGERQRVIFARAVAQETDLWILDEPTSFLDLRHQAVVHRLIRERALEGVGALVVLHDLNLAAALCTRVILLDDGEVVASGLPSEIFEADRLTQIYNTPLRVERRASGIPLVVADLEDRHAPESN